MRALILSRLLSYYHIASMKYVRTGEVTRKNPSTQFPEILFEVNSSAVQRLAMSRMGLDSRQGQIFLL
jgi:hypothetical protein